MSDGITETFFYSNGALQIDTLATPLLINDMRLAIDSREIERDLEIARKKSRRNPWVNVTDLALQNTQH